MPTASNSGTIFIHQIVQQAMTTGSLTVEAEGQLRFLLQTTKYSQEDINAFVRLQQAVMTGVIRQQSRELRACS
ncbi:MAG: hypothetical protein F6K31_06905 [Symploca sp. SIO2G7]|nr:hypothetical protein [Symploca sp. SIO2G7]